MGVVCTLAGGTLWGFSGTCGQYLFLNYGVAAGWVTSVRMLCAGMILLIIGMLTQREQMLSLLKNKRDVLQAVIFGVCGLAFSQFSYFMAISYTNSGTATILQYVGPVMVMIVSCFLGHRMPDRRDILAIALAIFGTFLLATHGDIHNMALTPKGLTWGLLSAVALMMYTMLPGKLTGKYGSIPVVAFGMLSGGIVMFVGGHQWTYVTPIHGSGFGILAAVILLGTVAAYTLYLQGVKEIGAVKGSMLSSVEPVSAMVFMVTWLGVEFGPMDAAGFACILFTVFLLARDKNTEKKPAEKAHKKVHKKIDKNYQLC